MPQSHSYVVAMTGSIPPELATLLEARDDAERDVAWDAFVARYSKLLLVVAREHGGTHDDVMDRYTVTLSRLRDDDFHRLRVWAGDRRSAITTWLAVIARRAALDEIRRRYGRHGGDSADTTEIRRQRRRLADLLTEDLLPELISSDALGTTETPELELRRAELMHRLDRCVAELSAEEQLLLVLRFRDARTADDIARILAWPSAFHVYRRLTRLANQLRDNLRRLGVEDPVP
jgi:RNA polymerase sigma factor (sigma-70 family)